MSALPTGDELKTLPLRAVVAYAHRCAARAARRCLPDSSAAGGMPSAFGCGEAVRRALRPAAKVAAGEVVSTRELTAAEDVIVATVARLGRGDEDREPNGARYANGTHLNPTGRGVAMTANSAYAALAAAAAVADEASGSRSIRGHRAVLSAMTAAEAAAAACPPIRIGIRRDFGLLTRLNLGAFPDPGRGVDVSDGGPLGPCGDDNRLAAVGARGTDGDEPEDLEDEREENASEPLKSENATHDLPVQNGEDAVVSSVVPTAEPVAAPTSAQRPAPELLSPSAPFGDPFSNPFGVDLTEVVTNPFADSAALSDWSPAAPDRTEPRRNELSRTEPPRNEMSRTEPGRNELSRTERAAGGGASRSSAALARREAALAARDAALSAREASLAERSAELADREADLAEREAELDDREAELDDHEAALEERAVALDGATRAVAERTRTAAGELSVVQAERQALEAAAAALREVFARHALLNGTEPSPPPRSVRPSRSESPPRIAPEAVSAAV